MSKQDDHDDARDKEHDACDHRGREQRHRRNWRHLVASEDVLFAFLNSAHPRAEQTIAENAEHDDHRHDLENGRSLVRVDRAAQK